MIENFTSTPNLLLDIAGEGRREDPGGMFSSRIEAFSLVPK